MTVNYAPVGGLLLGVPYLVLSTPETLTPVEIGVFWALVLVGTFLWAYSPLPEHNGGLAAHNDKGMFWGLTRKEDADD